MLGRSSTWACALALSAAFGARDAWAASPARACIEAHASGQIERDAGRLLSARERFSACASETCPPLIGSECVALREVVKSLTPSVVLVADDGQGRLAAGAHVTIDGERAIPALDGEALELDPGTHRFEFLLPDGRSQSLTVSLQPSEKYRRIVASFEPRAVPVVAVAGQDRVSRRHPLAYVFGGVGLAALGTWAAFAIDGRSKQSQLERCAPHCQVDDVHAMRRSYLIADVLLGVSVASFGTGAYVFFKRTDEPTPRGDARTIWLGASAHF